jgi:hypothetical protein
MAKDKETEVVDDEKQYVVDYIKHCHKEAKDAALGRRKVFKELWSAYQNKQDYKAKKSWQSKIFAPKVWMKVEKAAAEVKRALLQINKLFKFDIDDEQGWSDEQKDQLIENMPRLEAKFKRALEKSNIANVYSEMSKAAFLLGIGVPKCLWDDEKARLNYQNIQALNTFVSPDFKPFEDERPKYLIEEQEMDLASFRLEAARVNEAAGQEIYDMEVIDKLEEDFKDVETKAERQKRLGVSQYTDVSKRVLLWQFWGDIISEDGLEIEENQLCVLVNKKYLVRKHDNPFDHDKVPHVLTFPLPYPHRGIAGASLVEPTVKF